MPRNVQKNTDRPLQPSQFLKSIDFVRSPPLPLRRSTLKPGGRVGKFTLVERVQSLPASFSLPPPTVDAPHEVAVLGDGGAAAWHVLALSDAPNANETTDGLALLEVFRSSEPLSQRSLPAPLPAVTFGSASFDNSAAAQHALPRPFDEELESIAANRRYRLHRRVARGAHGEVWRAVRSDDARQKQLILKRLHAGTPHALAPLLHPRAPLMLSGGSTLYPLNPLTFPYPPGSAGMLAGLRERHFGERLRGTPHVSRMRSRMRSSTGAACGSSSSTRASRCTTYSIHRAARLAEARSWCSPLPSGCRRAGQP